MAVTATSCVLTFDDVTGVNPAPVTLSTIQTGAGYATLASPTFSGTPAAPTASIDTNTTQLASTAFILAQASAVNPLMNGAVAIGTSTRFARADHVHASDTSRAPSASPTFTGTVTLPASTSFITPIIGAATGTSFAATGAITSSGTTGIGYATGAGGTVSQATSKSTGVTLSKLCGTITMNAAALAAGVIVTFTVTNTLVAATDVVCAQHDSGGTIGSYLITPNTMASGSFKISVRNETAGSLSEAIVIRYVIVKAVVA